MPSEKKHPTVATAEIARERISAQKPKPKTSAKPKKIESPDTEEPLFDPPKLPTPFELADTIQVLKTAIHAMHAALAACERIYEAPWPIATDMQGNLYEQIDNLVTEDAQGLQWAICDMRDILEDLEDGPNQGEWIASVFAPPPESPKRSRRKRAAK